MNSLLKNFLISLLIIFLLSTIFSFFNQSIDTEKKIPLSQVIQDIEDEKINQILISDNNLEIFYKDGKKAISKKEPEISLSQLLLSYGVKEEKLRKVAIEEKEKTDIWSWLGPILYILPTLFLFFFFWLIFRQAKTGAGQVFDFTRARARIFGAGGEQKEKVTFDDIGGLKEAKEELKEVVDFLKNPKKYLQVGARIPRGVLLIGAPGTGKTLLAKAIASQANVPFFSISGSEFVELFVGVGSSSSYDTNILIRTKNSTKLLPIGEFVDQFFKENEEGLKNVEDIQTLGVDFARGKSFFKCSNWKKVKAVYRHRVDKIYEITFIGGKIKVTGDHSVFVRERNHIFPKKVSELKKGNILVALPYGVKGGYNPNLPLGKRQIHLAKAHRFPEKLPFEEITIWTLEDKSNNFGIHNSTFIPGSIAKILGLSNNTHLVDVTTLIPQKIKNLTYKIKVTPELMKLIGYYTAEGLYNKSSHDLRFCFGTHEKKYRKDCINLMLEIFNLKPSGFFYNNSQDKSALVFYYNSMPIARWFAKHSGSGAPNKHVPEFIWDLPREYFVSYLDGLVKGDGYLNKRKMIEFSSSSRQLISELRWLLNMHGIPCSVTEYHQEGGRTIKNSKKSLPDSIYWRITVATKINPLSKNPEPLFFKRPIIKKIEVKPYDGFVYDLCGCENEAFFGGEKPILLHNSRIRSLFEQARKAGKAIIFIDEIDSIGKIRGVGVTGGHEEREQTLNQLLSEMDGIGREEGILVFAATNQPEFLDPALLRPGRFDRRIILDLPDVKEREEILKIHCRGKPLASNVNLKEVTERTPGFSGADLANVINEAAILAARRNKSQISQEEILESIEKVLLGPERKSHILSKREKEIAAYHESGHALVASFLPEAEEVRKVSIVARGLAAGYTLKMPSEERKIKTKSQFLAEMATLLGGYTAEKIKFGEISTGAADDLKKASELARRLVKEYGMSDLGPITFGEREELIFLGRETAEQRNYSEKIAVQIDKEVEKFIKNAKEKAEQILNQKKKLLEKVAQTLMVKETIEKEEFEKLIKGKKEIKKLPKFASLRVRKIR
jgi:ATP-dependent metalloprotease FtsH